MHSQNRNLNTYQRLVFGLISGVCCFLVAESLTPPVSTPSDHDFLLAIRVGFIYTPIVGAWLGWIQKSARRTVIGILTGLFIGAVYTMLCQSREFLLIMVAFPCLLGGVLAAIAGSNQSPWNARFLARAAKGLCAGFALGLIYAVVLNALALIGIGFGPPATEQYVAMMWRAGPVALGLASAAFYVLMVWAVDLGDIPQLFKYLRSEKA